MNKLRLLLHVVILLSVSVFFTACPPTNDDDDDDVKTNIVLKFEHTIDTVAIEMDNMKYVNSAGNEYEVSEIQWFITDVVLHKKSGGQLPLNAWTFYHYIDTDIPSTLEWEIEDPVPPGEYESISFTFGIKGEKNEPYMFVNFPESAMFWPIHLGGDEGGYHYLKLNGFWKDVNNFRRGYQFHLGVGQKQDANGNRIKEWDSDAKDSTYVFVQNWFDVTLDNSAFTIEKNHRKEITIRMNVEQWFEDPNDYDFDYFGGETMENQEAQQAMKENGSTVFTVSNIEDKVNK